jgi:hypothetical protein
MTARLNEPIRSVNVLHPSSKDRICRKRAACSCPWEKRLAFSSGTPRSYGSDICGEFRRVQLTDLICGSHKDDGFFGQSWQSIHPSTWKRCPTVEQVFSVPKMSPKDPAEELSMKQHLIQCTAIWSADEWGHSILDMHLLSYYAIQTELIVRIYQSVAMTSFMDL